MSYNCAYKIDNFFFLFFRKENVFNLQKRFLERDTLYKDLETFQWFMKGHGIIGHINYLFNLLQF